MWDSKFDVYRTEWLDLVFADRNKSYGAYELRLHNDRTTIKALLYASGLTVSIILLLFIYSRTDNAPTLNSPTLPKDSERVLKMSKIPERKQTEVAELEPDRAIPQKKINMRKLVNLNVVPANMVTEEFAPIEELQRSVIGSQTTDGPSATVQNADVVHGNGSGEAGGAAAASGNEVVTVDFLEKYPEFPGGEGHLPNI